MREIAEHHDRAVLEAFAAWLSSTGVPCELVERDRRWRLAVADDHARDAAVSFARFLQEPTHPARRAVEAADTERLQATRQPWVTWVIVALAGAVTLYTDFARNDARFARFSFADLLRAHAPGEGPLVDILHGEVWRLATPALVHMNWLHLLFNAQWMLVLGAPIERALGRWRFVGVVLLIDALANVSQAVLDGPAFGGLSGVVYGLFGYFWLRGRREPTLGWRLGQRTVLLMIGWLVLCFTGVLGPIANAAHVAGLISGCALGWIAGGRRADAD